MPVAKGSRLPTWPALSAPSSRRTFCRAALDDSPRGLSSSRMPFTSPRAWAVIGGHRAIDQLGEMRGLVQLSSNTKESRGACRRPSWRPTAPRRNPPARVRPSATSAGSGACEGHEEDARRRQILRDLHRRDGHVADARILDLAADELGQHPLHLCFDLRPCRPPRGLVLARAHATRTVRATSVRVKHSIWSTDADILVVLHADAALGAGTNLAHVILEAPQRLELALEDHHAFTQHANRIVALDHAFGDQAAGHDAELAGAEHVAHLREPTMVSLTSGASMPLIIAFTSSMAS